MLFPQLAQRLFNCPLALHPPKAEIVMAALAERLGVTRMMHNGRQVPLALEYYDDDDLTPVEETPYDRVGGAAIISVRGTLVQRTGAMRPYSGMTGYDGIRKALLLALSDETVDAIVLDIDSPGGEVAGCFDIADTIFEARKVKPIRAILAESAYSAAYAIASAADRITVPRTGGTGSIGIICLHVDLSQALQEAGINVTMITFGSRKSEGSEYQPLTEGALARFQAEVDIMGALFCETVARNRGLSVEAVRNTEANTYLGALGVEAGLADEVMAPDEAFRALLASLH